MSARSFGRPLRALLLVGLSVVGIMLTLRAERSSEARANRLHRNDVLEEAATLYADRLLEDSAATRLHYNLGTTLLRLGSPGAYAELTAGSEADDERLRVRSLYNLGLWSLIQAMFSQTNDSTLFHAARAVETNKDVLRIDPEHADARWNLALAQLILVTATPESGPGNIDTPSGGPDVGERQLVNEPQPPESEEGYDDAPSEGEEESLPEEDLEPLSLAQASEILGDGHLDPSTMAGKLLLREGRAQRRRGVFVPGPPW